ncbi:MAG: hypothetical protein HOP08_19345 [Cyclobacteriaceae bacterium]|nr:hypothetical protein [Cyclobacteriaceae bacterium]
MGFSTGIIAIKGDHRGRATEIFKVFNYDNHHREKHFEHWDEVSEYLDAHYFELANKEIGLRAIWVDNDWTLICDPELVDPTEEIKLANLSKLLKAEVWTFLIQTTSETFSFAKYDQVNVRNFLVSGKRVHENSGTPLAEEKGYNINEKFCVGEVATLSKKLGININPDIQTDFVVMELDYDDELRAQLGI